MSTATTAPAKFEDITDAQRELLATACHEAAHAVIAAAYGAVIDRAVVLPPGATDADHLGKVTYISMPGRAEHPTMIGGSYFHSRFLVGRKPTLAEVRAVLESNGCKDFAALRASGVHVPDLTRYSTLFEYVSPAVVELARKLYLTGEADHADVMKVLGITDGGGETSAQVAHLRSGAVSYEKIPAISLT